MTAKTKAIAERIRQSIFLIRGQKVMLDVHLAELYAVETRALVQAVTRNRTRFPRDFMFRLTKREFASLRSQIVISNLRGGRRSAPYAFTEHGVAMLSSVLRSNARDQRKYRDRARIRSPPADHFGARGSRETHRRTRGAL